MSDQNEGPPLSGGGSVFGSIVSQWIQYFVSKVDANNGFATNLTLLGTLTATAQQIISVLGFTPLNAANNLSDVDSISQSRTNLGLGTMATQNANAVAITGGTITGVALPETNLILVTPLGGQSNNQGQSGDPTLSPKMPAGMVYEYYSGSLNQITSDPVGPASPSSAWPAWANTFLAAGTGVKICFVPCAVGGTDQSYQTGISSTNWDFPGNAGSTLAPALVTNTSAAMAACSAAGFTPILGPIQWGQGENDADAIGSNSSYPRNGFVLVTGGPYSAGTTAITIANSGGSGGVVSGQSAIITLDNGSTFTSAITVSGNNVTLTTAVPTGRSILTSAVFQIFSAAYYMAAFQRMAAYFRSRTIDGTIYPEWPIIISQLGAPQAGSNFGFDAVRQAQDDICELDPFTKIGYRGALSFVARGMMQNPAASYTASIAPGGSAAIMTVTAVASGTVLPDATISGSGVSAGTLVGEYISNGGVGGTGTYAVSPAQTVSSTTITQTGSPLHYLQEGYNEMGREMARATLTDSATEKWLNFTPTAIRVAIGGTLTNGDQLTITITSSAISGSPWLLGPSTVGSGSTFASIANQMASNGTIFSPNLAAVGVFVGAQTTPWGAVITIYQPTTLSPQATVTASWSGSGSETVAVTQGTSAYGYGKNILTEGTVAIGVGAPITSSGPGGALTTTGFAAAGQIPGTATNDNAATGNVGEYIESVIASGSAIGLTTATQTNLTSITLTAGDWDVETLADFTGGATTTITSVACSISLSSATIDNTNGRSDNRLGAGTTPFTTGVGVVTSEVGPRRLSLSGSTTVYSVVYAQFATSTLSVYGILRARRVR